MGDRIRVVLLFLVLLAVGAFLGSAIADWRARAGSEEEVRATGTSGAEASGPGRRIRVEVLNGAGREGMARRATEYLRERGFDVVYFGNADSFDRESSTVIDRVARLRDAGLVADALEIREVTSRPDSTLYLDVTVILGSDWSMPEPPPPAEEPRPWWDLRPEIRSIWERVTGFGEDTLGPDLPGGPDRLVDPSP